MKRINTFIAIVATTLLLLTNRSLPAQVLSPSTSSDTTNGGLKASGVKTGTNLARSVTQSPDHTTLLKLLEVSGLTKQASGKQVYTVFAPTNAAFSIMSEADLRELLLPSNRKQLVQLLAYHVVKGSLTSDRLKDGQNLTNLTGQILVIHKQGDAITVEDGRGNVADVVQANIRTTNGVVYSINKVLQKVVN